MSSMMSMNRVLPGSSDCPSAAPVRVVLSNARARACRRLLVLERRIRHPVIRPRPALHDAARGGVAVHVAGAAAVVQFVGRVGHALARFGMGIRLEIPGMAAG